MDSEQIKLSIIIPTLNEKARLSKFIESIDSLDTIPKEILIADGGSTDGTVEQVLALHKTNPKIKLVKNPNRFCKSWFQSIL